MLCAICGINSILVLGISYFLLAFPLLLKHALFVYRSKEPAVLRPMLAQMSMISLLSISCLV